MCKWLALVVFCFSIFCLLGCSSPEKPVLDGEGPLAIKINTDRVATPEFHNPLEDWKRRHMESVLEKEFTERECLSCHDVATSCNNCHSYVGVKKVSTKTNPGYKPGQDRVRELVNGTYGSEKNNKEKSL